MTISKSAWISILTTSFLFLGVVACTADKKVEVPSIEPANAQSSKIDMTAEIIEVATFKLKEGVTPDDFYPLDQAVASQHVSQQPGFISRESAVNGDEWLAVVHWRSVEDAESSMASFADAPATAAFMDNLQADTMVMNRYTRF